MARLFTFTVKIELENDDVVGLTTPEILDYLGLPALPKIIRDHNGNAIGVCSYD